LQSNDKTGSRCCPTLAAAGLPRAFRRMPSSPERILRSCRTFASPVGATWEDVASGLRRYRARTARRPAGWRRGPTGGAGNARPPDSAPGTYCAQHVKHWEGRSDGRTRILVNPAFDIYLGLGREVTQRGNFHSTRSSLLRHDVGTPPKCLLRVPLVARQQAPAHTLVVVLPLDRVRRRWANVEANN